MAVTDQIRAIAKERLQERLGEISPGDMQAVEAGVLRILELG
jgi:mRNA-degrading endonuclease toxin of MazEF toxin-antitoxin module